MMGPLCSGGEKGGWQPVPTKDFVTTPMWITEICENNASHSGFSVFAIPLMHTIESSTETVLVVPPRKQSCSLERMRRNYGRLVC